MTTRTQPTHVLEVRQLRRRYGGPGGFEAVRGVDLDVRPGELFALLGTNGAGKTSTLELLEGLERPSGGTVRLLGHDPYRHRRKVRPHIGIMLQDGGFPTGLTVAEAARMWAGTLTTPRPVGAMLEQVGLAHRAGTRIGQLSGGEKRRLELGIAVLGDPKVLFLDEPTAGLDPESRRAAWRMLRERLHAGTTIVLTTHYLAEAEELADRLAILHEGLIVATGTPAEVAASRPARISFTLRPGQRLPVLPAVAEVGSSNGGRVDVLTHDLQPTLTGLLAWAAAEEVDLRDLKARPASLEEAFLAVADTGGDLAASTGPGTGTGRADPAPEEAVA